jgi:CNT family concentrative nucleoside transporter
MERVISGCGLLVMVLLAWLVSTHRRRFPWRVVLGGLGLQIFLAWAILGSPERRDVFQRIGDFFTTLLNFVDSGCEFVFGPNYGDFYFAFRVLPTIIFFSSLMAVLYHIGLLQLVVRGLGFVMRYTLRTSGAESLSAASNIFVGQTEAPFVISPYIPTMTQSELMAVMVGGFATVAGGVLAVYISFGVDAGHLVAASFISAPAGLVIAKIMVPETETPQTLGTSGTVVKRSTSNLIEAATNGATDGLKLALNVAAMLIAFMALIAMVDFVLERLAYGLLTQMLGWKDAPAVTLAWLCGHLFRPIAFVMGIPWEDCFHCGQLLGLKMVANELLAYQQMSLWLDGGEGMPVLQERSTTILTYALCGFANFASIGIQVGGIGGLAPERRKDLAQLGFRAMIGGTLACFMTACVAGMLLP